MPICVEIIFVNMMHPLHISAFYKFPLVDITTAKGQTAILWASSLGKLTPGICFNESISIPHHKPLIPSVWLKTFRAIKNIAFIKLAPHFWFIRFRHCVKPIPFLVIRKFKLSCPKETSDLFRLAMVQPGLLLFFVNSFPWLPNCGLFIFFTLQSFCSKYAFSTAT